MKRMLFNLSAINKAAMIVLLLCCLMTFTKHAEAQITAGPEQTICLNGTATMAATGTGTWTARAYNPSSTSITDSSSPSTTITGFSVAGNYVFQWGALSTDTVIIIADTSVTPYISVSVSSQSMSVCNGVTDTFTAINLYGSGGTSPVFQWYINGTSYTADSNIFIHTFSTATNTVDTVFAVMTSSLACASPSSSELYDDPIPMMVYITPPTPVLSLVGSCQTGDTLVLSNLQNPNIISWYSGSGVLNYRSYPNPAVTSSSWVPSGPGTYFATYTSVDGGCLSAPSNSITVPVCYPTFDTLNLCRGASDTLHPYLAPDSYTAYIWTPGTGLNNPHILNPIASPTATTTYILSTVDTAGNLFHDTVLVIIDTSCNRLVWPGDADNNGIADNTDLLPIGLAFNLTGPARAQQDMLWQAHNAAAWSGTNVGGINNVYSDCNGDGVVDINDINAILNNYSLTHAKAGDLSQNRSGDPFLKLVVTPDTLQNGEGFVCHVILGDSNDIIASNVYGVAFTLNYNSLVVDSGNIEMSFPDCWLATQSEHITLAKNDFESGAIYAGLSRIDRMPRSGAGEIALINMVITTDNIDGKNLSYYVAQFSISNVKVVNQFGDTIPVNRQGDSAIIEFFSTGVNANGTDAAAIKLFPDPANNVAEIRSIGGKMSSIILSDVLGRHVRSYEMNTSNFEMPTTDLRPGVYFAQITIANHITVKKFLVQH